MGPFYERKSLCTGLEVHTEKGDVTLYIILFVCFVA